MPGHDHDFVTQMTVGYDREPIVQEVTLGGSNRCDAVSAGSSSPGSPKPQDGSTVWVNYDRITDQLHQLQWTKEAARRHSPNGLS